MNAIDQWEAEEAAAQLAVLRKEDAEFAALPEVERSRILKEGRDLLEAFSETVESDEDEDEDH